MTADTRAKPPARNDDSGAGLAMFVIFSAAVLFVTGAVALLALVGSWWMLGLAFAVHVGVTAVVIVTIAHVMSPHGLATRGSETETAPASRPRESPSRRAAVAGHS